MKDINHMIAVMTAANEGKTIQILYHDDIDAGWIDTTRPLWDWRTCDYRVKPAEPRRVWLNVYPTEGRRSTACFDSREEAARFARHEPSQQIEFVEVVE